MESTDQFTVLKTVAGSVETKSALERVLYNAGEQTLGRLDGGPACTQRAGALWAHHENTETRWMTLTRFKCVSRLAGGEKVLVPNRRRGSPPSNEWRRCSSAHPESACCVRRPCVGFSWSPGCGRRGAKFRSTVSEAPLWSYHREGVCEEAHRLRPWWWPGKGCKRRTQLTLPEGH